MSLPPRPVLPLLLSLPCVTAPSVLKHAGAVVSSCIEVVQSRPSFDPPNGGARGGSKGDAKGRACKLVGVIMPLLLLPCGHHSRAGSRGNAGERRLRVCRSARRCARRGRA